MTMVTNIFYGILNIKNIKTNKTSTEISDVSNSVYLAACLLNEKINELEKNKDLIIEKRELSNDYFLTDFINNLKLKEKIHYVTELNNPNPDSEIYQDFYADCISMGYTESEAKEEAGKEYTSVNFLDMLHIYKGQSQDIIDSVIKDFISESNSDEPLLVSYFEESKYINKINKFKNSSDYLTYQEEIEEILECENYEIEDKIEQLNTIEMKDVFYGILEIENKETKEIEYRMTKVTDSAELVACFIEQQLKEIELDPKFGFVNYNFEHDKISKETICGLNPKQAYLIYNIDVIQSSEEDSEDFYNYLINEGVSEEEALEESEYYLEPSIQITFLDAISDFKDFPSDIINEVLKGNLSEKFVNENSFMEYSPEVNNSDLLNDFKNSVNYETYKYEIDEVIKSSKEEDFEYNLDNEEAEDIDPDMLVSLYSSQINELTYGKWSEQLRFLKDLYDRNDLFISIVSAHNEDYGTFGQDNKEFLFSFIRNQIKEGIEDSTFEDQNFGFIFTIRQFTNIMHKPNVPVKRVAMCWINNTGIFPISKKETTEAHMTCAETGRKLKKEQGVQFLGFQKMMECLNISG